MKNNTSGNKEAFKIVIAGCSYSTDDDFRLNKSEPFYSWAREIGREYECENIARHGLSLQETLERIERSTWDFLIVNLTSINRGVDGTYPGDRYKQPPRWFRDQNAQIAQQIVTQPRCYCWSPFPEWQKSKQVDSIINLSEDELWGSTGEITGNHLTRAGNDLLLHHMREKIASASRMAGELDDAPRN